jgi:hypothetical protein
LDLDVRAVGRGASCHEARVDQRSEQFHPKPPLRPAVEAIIDRRRRTVVRQAVAPPAAELEHVDNARNYPPVIDSPGAGLLGKCGSIAFHAASNNQNNAIHRLHRHTLCESRSPLQINSLIGFEP